MSKPKIALMTNLFPEHELDTKSPWALYDLVKYWPLEDLQIWRLYPSGIRSLHYPHFSKTHIGDFEVCHSSAFYFPRWNHICTFKGKHIFQRESFDVIVSHCRESHIIGHQMSKIMDIPHIVGLHMSDSQALSKPQSTKAKTLRRIFQSATAVSYRSEAIRNRVISRAEMPQEEMIAYSGIPSSLVADEAPVIQKHRDGKNHLLSAGRLIPQKYFLENILALAELTRYPFHFFLAGDGEELSNIEKAIEKHHLQERVKVSGWLKKEELLLRMQEREIFVMISAPETFGLVYLEAMASGCLTICSKDWGVDGIIRDGENGFVCRAGDVEQLKAILQRIFNLPPEEKIRIALNARRTALDLDEEKCSMDYYEFIRRAVAHRSSPLQSPH